MTSFTEVVKMKNVSGIAVTQIQWLALKVPITITG